MLRKPIQKVVSIDSARCDDQNPDPSPASAARCKAKNFNQFSRLRFFALTLGPFLWSEEKAAKETGYDATVGKGEIKRMARAEWERQQRRAA